MTSRYESDFLKSFVNFQLQDLILALRNEHSKVNPIRERRKKDMKLKKKSRSRRNDMEQVRFQYNRSVGNRCSW